jgi:hypothetical protein
LTRQAGCALPTISKTWLREEKAAVDKRSLCEPTNRKPDQYYGSRAELPGVSGQILRRVELLCPDDESAKAHARQLLDGFTVELWEAARLVAVFSPK